MRMFFFGTLLDMDLLATVLGADPAEHLSVRSASLPGYDRRRAEGEDYPVLIEDAEARVSGLLVDGLWPVAVERIRFFEGGEYALETVNVHGPEGETRAAVFMATEMLPASEDPWDLTQWQAARKPHAMITAELLMANFGTLTLAEMDARWGEVKAEADRLLAERTAAQ